jgi:hypothetical protein
LWTPARNNAQHFKDKNDPWVSEKYGGAISTEKRHDEIDISGVAHLLAPADAIYAQAKARSVL